MPAHWLALLAPLALLVWMALRVWMEQMVLTVPVRMRWRWPLVLWARKRNGWPLWLAPKAIPVPLARKGFRACRVFKGQPVRMERRAFRGQRATKATRAIQAQQGHKARRVWQEPTAPVWRSRVRCRR